MTTPPPELPSWIDRVGVFDLETTGVDVSHDRIVSAHVGILDRRGSEIAARTWLADPGIPIPDAASAIHGISTAQAQRDGAPAHEVVAAIVSSLRALLDQGVPIVAYNASYDLSLLDHEARRYGIAPLASPSPVIDPLVIDKAYDRYRPGKRTLDVVAAHYDISLVGAHDASADAVAAGRVAQAIARRFELPPTADELHSRQIGWARAQAASLTEYFISIGRIEPEETIDGTWPVRAAEHEEEPEPDGEPVSIGRASADMLF